MGSPYALRSCDAGRIHCSPPFGGAGTSDLAADSRRTTIFAIERRRRPFFARLVERHQVGRAWRKPMRILIAEDDPDLAAGLCETLRHSGHAVDWVKDGVKADVALGTNEFDLLILDLSLPRLHGFEVLKRLRARASRLPVLLLTALDSVDDRVRGLDAGADDYLAKPFQLAELEARVRALTRRGMLGTTTLIKHGELCFDQVGRVATLCGKRLEFSARELSLLELFLQRPGRLIDKERLVAHLCEWGDEVSTNAIEVYVHRLRKKLEPGGIRISTVRGVGYCFDDPAET